MTARPFAATLKAIHADAVRCAIADHDANRDGREPDQRLAAVSAALECAAGLDYGFHLTPSTRPVVDFWLRCYDRMTETLREPPPPFVSGQRVRVLVGAHKGRLGTVRMGAIPGEPTIEIDPYGPHVGPLYIRTPRPATFAEWVQ